MALRGESRGGPADRPVLAVLIHQYDRPFTVNGERVRAELGAPLTPLAEAVAVTTAPTG